MTDLWGGEMTPPINFPHAGTYAVDLVNAHLPAGIVAYKRVPPDAAVPRPSEFIVISVAGGVSETIVTNAVQLIVDGYATKDARAYELCDLALSIIRSADGLIRGARGFGYPQSLPDPTTSQTRYTSTGAVRIWASAPS